MDDDELNTTHEDCARTWLDHYNQFYGPRGVEKLASRYRDGQHCECLGFVNGGFNICFKVLFDDGVLLAVRFPVPGWVMFTLFLRALEDVESRREKDLALEQPDERRISTAMRQSFEDGTFWFVQLLLQSFNFDGDALWPHLEPFLRDRGLLEVGIPDEKEVEEFVAMKMRDLHAYKEELQEKSG